ncbi:3661_t:CDS:2, partial [Scutellospora calospora]
MNCIFIVVSIIIFFYSVPKGVYSIVFEGRAEHNAVLINKKLYFYGGYVQNQSSTARRFANNVLLFLNISMNFSISDISLMPWTDLSSIRGTTNRTGASAYSSIIRFDITTQQWITPTISGSIPPYLG